MYFLGYNSSNLNYPMHLICSFGLGGMSSVFSLPFDRSEWRENLNRQDEEVDELLRKAAGFKQRIQHACRNYMRSPWAMFICPTSEFFNPDSWQCKVFRSRFRVPFKFYFEVLLPYARDCTAIGDTSRDAAGRMGIPLEYKILGTLRILGRAAHFDCIAEYTNSGFKGEGIRVFFHKFCAEFVKDKFHSEVRWPTTQEDIKKHMKLYSLAGMDGCIASVDGVHFYWDKCPLHSALHFSQLLSPY